MVPFLPPLLYGMVVSALVALALFLVPPTVPVLGWPRRGLRHVAGGGQAVPTVVGAGVVLLGLALGAGTLAWHHATAGDTDPFVACVPAFGPLVHVPASGLSKSMTAHEGAHVRQITRRGGCPAMAGRLTRAALTGRLPELRFRQEAEAFCSEVVRTVQRADGWSRPRRERVLQALDAQIGVMTGEPQYPLLQELPAEQVKGRFQVYCWNRVRPHLPVMERFGNVSASAIEEIFYRQPELKPLTTAGTVRSLAEEAFGEDGLYVALTR